MSPEVIFTANGYPRHKFRKPIPTRNMKKLAYRPAASGWRLHPPKKWLSLSMFCGCLELPLSLAVTLLAILLKIVYAHQVGSPTKNMNFHIFSNSYCDGNLLLWICFLLENCVVSWMYYQINKQWLSEDRQLLASVPYLSITHSWRLLQGVINNQQKKY